ncbi:MAG TPA: hypothetical protein VK923_15455 [Euzebyales bacterium]|nr:hypothetical protein [Euzebyales bacterium]
MIDAAGSDRTDLVVELFCIEGRWFTPQAGVSPEVVAAVHDLADRVLGALAGGRGGSWNGTSQGVAD